MPTVREGPGGRIALFDPDMIFRYRLAIPIPHPLPGPSRDLAPAYPLRGTCLFIMLNPSTADETANDPTIRRCIGFASLWGFRHLVIGNLFALRSTDPQALYTAPDPIGVDNDSHLSAIADEALTSALTMTLAVICASRVDPLPDEIVTCLSFASWITDTVNDPFS